MDNFNFAQQGWQCPICKRVYSPSTPYCFTCGAESSSFISTSTGYATYTAEDMRGDKDDQKISNKTDNSMD